MTRYLIDADMAIYSMSKRFCAVNDRLSQCFPGEVAISAISFAEIAVGTFTGEPPSSDVLARFIDVIPILPFDDAAANAYACLPFKGARFDRLLAAHALSLDAAIVTNNEADFADVAALKVENWSK